MAVTIPESELARAATSSTKVLKEHMKTLHLIDDAQWKALTSDQRVTKVIHKSSMNLKLEEEKESIMEAVREVVPCHWPAYSELANLAQRDKKYGSWLKKALASIAKSARDKVTVRQSGEKDTAKRMKESDKKEKEKQGYTQRTCQHRTSVGARSRLQKRSNSAGRSSRGSSDVYSSEQEGCNEVCIVEANRVSDHDSRPHKRRAVTKLSTALAAPSPSPRTTGGANVGFSVTGLIPIGEGEAIVERVEFLVSDVAPDNTMPAGMEALALSKECILELAQQHFVGGALEVWDTDGKAPLSGYSLTKTLQRMHAGDKFQVGLLVCEASQVQECRRIALECAASRIAT